MIECRVIDQGNRAITVHLQVKPAVGEVINLEDGWGVVRQVEHSCAKPLDIHIDRIFTDKISNASSTKKGP